MLSPTTNPLFVLLSAWDYDTSAGEGRAFVCPHLASDTRECEEELWAQWRGCAIRIRKTSWSVREPYAEGVQRRNARQSYDPIPPLHTPADLGPVCRYTSLAAVQPFHLGIWWRTESGGCEHQWPCLQARYIGGGECVSFGGLARYAQRCRGLLARTGGSLLGGGGRRFVPWLAQGHPWRCDGF
jgi:hypothetical protein